MLEKRGHTGPWKKINCFAISLQGPEDIRDTIQFILAFNFDTFRLNQRVASRTTFIGVRHFIELY